MNHSTEQWMDRALAHWRFWLRDNAVEVVPTTQSLNFSLVSSSLGLSLGSFLSHCQWLVIATRHQKEL